MPHTAITALCPVLQPSTDILESWCEGHEADVSRLPLEMDSPEGSSQHPYHSELTPRGDHRESKEVEQGWKFCCCLLPHPVSPLSKDRGSFFLSYQKKRMKEAMFTITGLAVETEIGKTHKLKAVPLHHALLQWELSCLQDLFLPLPPSLEGEEKNLLVLFPVRDVMLSHWGMEEDFCWEGVQHCFPSSLSDVVNTSSPMRIHSKLLSSKPFLICESFNHVFPVW